MTDIAYVGFDCSSKAIHCVVLDSEYNLITKKKWASKEKTFEERFKEFSMSFWADLSKIYITDTGKEQVKVAIEQAILIQNPKTTIEIANVIGCVRAGCHRNNYDVVVVDNSRWKKSVIGNGNASKADILSHAKEIWGDVFEEQDFADAACIAAWRLKEDLSESTENE